MLYETLSQSSIFLYLTLGGFFSGFFLDIKNILHLIFKKNKIFSHIFDFFAVIFVLFLFYLINLKINYGEIRLFSIISFFLSLLIERFFSINILAKPIVKCYNKIKGKRNETKRKNKKI